MKIIELLAAFALAMVFVIPVVFCANWWPNYIQKKREEKRQREERAYITALQKAQGD